MTAGLTICVRWVIFSVVSKESLTLVEGVVATSAAVAAASCPCPCPSSASSVPDVSTSSKIVGAMEGARGDADRVDEWLRITSHVAYGGAELDRMGTES